MKRHKKVTFKPYNQNQLMLPMSLDVMIPQNHLVRVVNQAIERMNIEPLLKKYKGGGTSSYHPKMMLKVLVYAYSQKIYGSRRIAKALRENIHFMWLSAQNEPDFRTINRFRSSKLKDVVDDVFMGVLQMLIETGHVKLQNYFLDGTKVEANANKYTHVWSKSTSRYKNDLQGKIRELLKQIEAENELENKIYGDKDLEELGEDATITAEQLEKTVEELNKKLAEEPKNKKLKKAVREIEKDYLPRTKKYETYEEIADGRNSFSKTDHDATFMHMKDTPKNVRISKPGYNVQIGTENQFIVGYSIHQKPADSTCLIPHLNRLEEMLGQLPENIIADAGYGSEENYEFLLDNEINTYVKHSSLCKKAKKRIENNKYHFQNWPYDPESDQFICPAQKIFHYDKTEEKETSTGYTKVIRYYESEDCSDCPFKQDCTKAEGNRRIAVNFRLNELKQIVKKNLDSEVGQALYCKRGTEAETPFGNIKWNLGLCRFLLRGLDKVHVEWGLASIAHNLIKLTNLNNLKQALTY